MLRRIAVVGIVVLQSALGDAVSVSDGVLAFIRTALGGVVLGSAIGFVVAFVLPWLDGLTATAVTVSWAARRPSPS